MSAPPRTPQRTRFRRGAVLETKDARIAKYEGWVRSDVSAEVTLRMPGMKRNPRVPGRSHAAMVVRLEVGTTKRIDLTAN